MALPQTVAVGLSASGQASTIACLPPQPGRQDAEQMRSQLDRRLDGQTVGRVGVLPSWITGGPPSLGGAADVTPSTFRWRAVRSASTIRRPGPATHPGT